MVSVSWTETGNNLSWLCHGPLCGEAKQKCVFLCASECVLPSSTSGTAAAAATLGLHESHKSLLFLKVQQMKKAVYDSAWWRERLDSFFVWVCVINPQWDLSCCVSLSVCVFLHSRLVCFETSLSGFSVLCTGAGVCVWPLGHRALARSHSIIPLECLALALSA